jgi:hypothetical protein
MKAEMVYDAYLRIDYSTVSGGEFVIIRLRVDYSTLSLKGFIILPFR